MAEVIPAELIRKAVQKGANILGEWPKAACEFIDACIAAGGIPQFVPMYAGEEWKLPVPGTEVLVRCWVFGAPIAPKPKGGFITNVPDEVIKRMEETTGDYRWIKDEYC